MNAFQILSGICLGIGLSAACGFRVFVPMFILSIAGRVGAAGGGIDLTPGWEWISSVPAIITFGSATAFEIAAYYIPWLDNLLDSIAAPAAIIAGMVATASCVGDVHPVLKWGLAIIAGGGAAAMTQGLTTVTRALSTTTTGGAGNPVVSTAEAGISIGLSLVAVVIPLVAALLVMALSFYALRFLYRWAFKKKIESESGDGGVPGVA
ncbi:MAG: DUF4126 domain-containing protein [Planctomycetes bacterium]|nr:DUF4126 domain-containing protein [Planctomycetota bacterium]